ncbi:hypothetical protein [Streptomyces sp. NBC_00102]|uniref:hypothetical protein n=1 Tax=Streptomyces sp. NBC_00102 TaxID=2975652 RepID=UPI002257EB26|nr:hypothetical protein [Streptomyces sp. NBC_00102]MCX5397525.1 hypothetical protein [Streptomyces sp. NBC_00102]
MINLQVRGDGGDIVARAEAGVEWCSAFGDLDPARFPMLQALIPFGDAMFNLRQVPLLLAELDRLPTECTGDWVAQARELCQVVARGPHRYLWFLGD